jgi:O-antigen ligase
MAAYPDWPPYAHAHNAFINLAAETGVLGLGAALWLIGVVVWKLWQEARRGDRWAIGALAACAALAVHSLVDVPSSRNYIVFTILLVVRLGLGEPATQGAVPPSGVTLEAPANASAALTPKTELAGEPSLTK